MPAPQAHLDLADAAELAETLTFISQWPGGTDHAQLAASFGRFIGTPGYDLTDLRTPSGRRSPGRMPIPARPAEFRPLSISLTTGLLSTCSSAA